MRRLRKSAHLPDSILFMFGFSTADRYDEPIRRARQSETFSRRTRRTVRSQQAMPKCPQCGNQWVCPASRRGVHEFLLACLLISPFRCQLCANRFLASRAGPGFNPRREYRRLPVQYPVSFGPLSADSEEKEQEGMMVNLSIQGCLVRSDTSPVRGTRLRLRIHTMDGEPPLEIAGAEVRSVKDNRIGLLFSDIGPQERERLQLIIARRLRRGSFLSPLVR